jgi:hypothetical protein
MNTVKLKEFVLKELQKDVPQEIAKDEKKAQECIVTTINEPLIDKLVAEFCEKNPQDLEVLNVFKLNDEELEEIKATIAAGIADRIMGTIERLKYKQAVNNAGLAYQSAVLNEKIDDFFTSYLSDLA